MNDYNLNHYRFPRQLSDPHAVEIYEPRSKFRWALVIAAVCLLLVAFSQVTR